MYRGLVRSLVGPLRGSVRKFSKEGVWIGSLYIMTQNMK